MRQGDEDEFRAGSWLAVFALFGILGAQGQAAHQPLTQQAIQAWLTSGPFVLLRGMWAGNELDFDPQGKLKGQADTEPLGTSAMLADQVTLSPDHLTVTGTRAGLEFPNFTTAGGRKQLRVLPVDRKKRALSR